MNGSTLSVEQLGVSYGPLKVVRNASFAVAPHSIVAVVGLNGAGKSSLVKGLAGIERATGAVSVDGQRIDRLKPWKRLRHGFITVLEGRRLFRSMTVAENLQVGAWLAAADYDVNLERVDALFPMLTSRPDLPAALLSGGQQQMLAIAQGLMGSPKVLVLDEPLAGLAPVIVDEVLGAIRKMRDFGVTVLLIDQSVHTALRVADAVATMRSGILSAVRDVADLDKAALIEDVI